MRSEYILKSYAKKLTVALSICLIGFTSAAKLLLAEIKIDELTKINALINGAVAEIRDVVLIIDGVRASADKARYDSEKNIIYLENATLIENQVIISAELVSIKSFKFGLMGFSNMEVSFEFARFMDVSMQTYVTARRLKRLKADKYYAEDVVLTQCNEQREDLTLHAKHLYYEFNNFAYGYHSWIKFYKVPVLYVPVYAFPTVHKRKSGFLLPYIRNVGINKGNGHGLMFGIPYFIEFGKKQDLTIEPEIYFQVGLSLGLEYNYSFKKWQRGQFYAWLMSEFIRDRKINEEYRMTSRSYKNPTRFTAHAYHKDIIGDKFKFYIKLEANSDKLLKIDYKKSQEYALKDLISAEASFFGQNYYAYSYSITKNEFQYASRYDKTIDPKSLHQNKLAVKYEFNYFKQYGISAIITPKVEYFSRKESWRGVIGGIPIDLIYQKNIWFINTYFKFTETLGLYSTNQFQPTTSGIDKGRNDFFIHQAKIDLNFYFDILKTSPRQKDNPAGYIFKIRPFLNFQWQEDVDQRDLLSANKKNLKYSLEDYYDNDQKFSSEFLKPAKLALILGTKFTYNKTDANNYLRHNLELQFQTILNLLRSKNLADKNRFKGPTIEESYQESKLGVLLLPFRIDLTYNFNNNIGLYFKNRYDISRNKILEYKLGIKFSDNNDNFLDFEYHYNGDSFRDLDGRLFLKKNRFNTNLNFNLNDVLKVKFQQNLNLLRNKLFDKSDIVSLKILSDFLKVEVEYINCCYKVNFGYKEEVLLSQKLNTKEEYLRRTIYLSFELFRNKLNVLSTNF